MHMVFVGAAIVSTARRMNKGAHTPTTTEQTKLTAESVSYVGSPHQLRNVNTPGKLPICPIKCEWGTEAPEHVLALAPTDAVFDVSTVMPNECAHKCASQGLRWNMQRKSNEIPNMIPKMLF